MSYERMTPLIAGCPVIKMELPNGLRSFDRKKFLQAATGTDAGVWFVSYRGDGGMTAIATRFPDDMLPGLRQSYPILDEPKNKIRHVIKWSDEAFWGLAWDN